MKSLSRSGVIEPKNIFFIPNQLEGFLSLSQKFEKTMNENS